MSASPREQSSVQGSPQRYHNRYSERYKSVLNESPPRDFNSLNTPERPMTTLSISTKAGSNLKTSPLQHNRSKESKAPEVEKFTTMKIKNDDRGEWRESVEKSKVVEKKEEHMEKKVDQVERLEIKRLEVTKSRQPQQLKQMQSKQLAPNKHTTPTLENPTKSKQIRSITTKTKHKELPAPQPESTQKEKLKQIKSEYNRLPHYMQVTANFEQRLTQTEEKRRSNANTLGPRSKGGITKRVTTAKVPRFKATTTINAIKDIQNEMQPDDTYVSMAARIKLFEKGLGNASNASPPPMVHRSSSTTSSPNSSQQEQRTKSPILSQSSQGSSSVPSYARRTFASETKESSKRTSLDTPSNIGSHSSSQTSRSRKKLRTDKSKPETFYQKLDLWRAKEELSDKEFREYQQGLKRKFSTK